MLLEDGLKRVRECSGLSSGNSLCLLSTACEIGLFALNGLNHLEYKQSSVRGWLTLDVQKCFLSFSSKVCRFFCPCVTQRRVQRGVSLFSHVLEGGRGKSSPFHSIISYLHLPEDFFFHEPSTDIRIIQVPEDKAPLPRDPWAQFPRMERISSWVPRLALGQRGSSNTASQEIHFSGEFLDSYNRFSCSLLAK